MTRLFILCCATAALLLTLHAAFAPLYESGLHVYMSLVGFMAFAALFIAGILRKPWSWRLVLAVCIVEIVVNIVFPPMPKHFGPYTTFARVLVAAEILVCALVLFSMRNSAVKHWFRATTPSRGGHA